MSSTPAGRTGSYLHVDVFASRPLEGNGLIVFPEAMNLPSALMQKLTEEMKQFESIFLSAPDTAGAADARIFTVEEELEFAGHPLLGAAAMLHREYAVEDEKSWTLKVAAADVAVRSQRLGNGHFSCTMTQPAPVFGLILKGREKDAAAERVGLDLADLDPDLPLQVVSTGLSYLLMPVLSGLDRAGIRGNDYESWLAGFGAKFVYLYDTRRHEGRTWDNKGLVEDVATGSAAGPTAAWLHRYGQLRAGDEHIIHQGTHAGRPSRIVTRVVKDGESVSGIEVGGEVFCIAAGVLMGDMPV